MGRPISRQHDTIDNSGWREIVPRASGLVALTAALTYPVGLIALNSYLHHVGASAFTVVSSRCVAVGILTVGWMFLGLFFPFLLIFYWHRERRRNKLLIAASLACLSFQFVVTWGGQYRKGAATEALMAILGEILLGFCILFLVSLLAKKKTGHHVSGTGKTVLAVILTFAIPIVTIGCVYQFGKTVFPKMSAEFGGGRPGRVQLLIKPDAVSSLALLGIAFQEPRSHGASAALTSELEVLFEDEHIYVLRTAEQKVIEVDKSEKLGAIPLH